MTRFGSPFSHRSARRWLGRLHDDVGAAGLAAAAALPGLAAAVDQHAAAVRDATTLGMEGSAAAAGLILLASYGRGVLEQARRQGWQPSAPAGWASADWLTVRLVAVCALAGSHATAARRLPAPGSPPPLQA